MKLATSCHTSRRSISRLAACIDCIEDFVEDIMLTDASYMPAHLAPKLGFEDKKKPMSVFAMLMDASDGKMDGEVDLDGVAHTSLMGDKRWG